MENNLTAQNVVSRSHANKALRFWEKNERWGLTLPLVSAPIFITPLFFSTDPTFGWICVSIGLLFLILGILFWWKLLQPVKLLEIFAGLGGFSLALLGIFYEANSDEISCLLSKEKSAPFLEWGEKNIAQATIPGNTYFERDSVSAEKSDTSQYFFAIDLSGSIGGQPRLFDRPIWFDDAYTALRDQIKINSENLSIFLRKGQFSLKEIQFLKAAHFMSKLAGRDNAKIYLYGFGNYSNLLTPVDGTPCTNGNVQKVINDIFTLMNKVEKDENTDFIALFKQINTLDAKQNACLIILSDMLQDRGKYYDRSDNKKEVKSSKIERFQKERNLRDEKDSLQIQIRKLKGKDLLANIVLLYDVDEPEAYLVNKSMDNDYEYSISQMLLASFPPDKIDFETLFSTDSDFFLYKQILLDKPLCFYYSHSNIDIMHFDINIEAGSFTPNLVSFEEVSNFQQNSVWCQERLNGSDIGDGIDISHTHTNTKSIPCKTPETLRVFYNGYPKLGLQLPLLKIKYSDGAGKKLTYYFKLVFLKKLSFGSSYLMFLSGGGAVLFLLLTICLIFTKANKIIKAWKTEFKENSNKKDFNNDLGGTLNGIEATLTKLSQKSENDLKVSDQNYSAGIENILGKLRDAEREREEMKELLRGKDLAPKNQQNKSGTQQNEENTPESLNNSKVNE